MKRGLGVSELVTATLPIGVIDAKSGNGWLYRESAVRKLVDQVNTKRVEGFWGHLRDDEIGTRYDPPAVRWLAADMDSSGVAWGLAVALTESARAHFISAGATKAKTGTSILGWNVEFGDLDIGEILGYDLISIDLASAERVGVPITAAHPIVSIEMMGEKKDMAAQDKTQETNGSGGTTTSDVMKSENDRLATELASANQRISTLRMNEQDLKATRELLGLKDDEDVVQGIRNLQREKNELAAENMSLMKNYITEEIAGVVKFEEIRPIVSSLVLSRKPSTTAQVKEIITQVVSSDEVKILLEMKRKEEGGPDIQEQNNRKEKGGKTEEKSESKYLQERPSDDDLDQ